MRGNINVSKYVKCEVISFKYAKFFRFRGISADRLISFNKNFPLCQQNVLLWNILRVLCLFQYKVYTVILTMRRNERCDSREVSCSRQRKFREFEEEK